MCLHDINPHLALWRSETYEHPEDIRWSRFCDDVAEALNVPHLDGDDDVEGYSIDAALSLFNEGLTVQEAAEEFAAIMEEPRPVIDELDAHAPDPDQEACKDGQ